MTSSTGPSMRATKRKLDDAFHSLDDAVGSPQGIDERPSQSKKKSHTARSLYSTLAKYGIKTSGLSKPETPGRNSEAWSKSTPHLTAVLSRAASRTPRSGSPSKATELQSPQPSSSATEYRPSSIPSFLSRLATFKLATYGNKPATIDAVAASKCGWVNDGKDRLKCGLCNISWVIAGKEGMNRDAADALIEKQRLSLVEMHKNGCPWKARQCDATIYRIPLQSPAAMVRDLKNNALVLDSFLQDVKIKHPLTSNQLVSLRSTVASFSSSEDSEASPTSSLPPINPSETAILTSLFGWSLAPERPRMQSLSRVSSTLNSRAATPSMSRASSVVPDGSSPLPLPTSASLESVIKRDTPLVHCILCQRRVGLWAFAPQKSPTDKPIPQRQFDLLQEHRSYCPYVVRSTQVPCIPTRASTPAPPPTSSRLFSSGHMRTNSRSSSMSERLDSNGQSALGTDSLEGWRAVLTVVLRYGLAQRHHDQLSRSRTEDSGHDNERLEHMDVDDLDSVGSMIEGVKAHGGKDLLKYVKGLLA